MHNRLFVSFHFFIVSLFMSRFQVLLFHPNRLCKAAFVVILRHAQSSIYDFSFAYSLIPNIFFLFFSSLRFVYTCRLLARFCLTLCQW